MSSTTPKPCDASYVVHTQITPLELRNHMTESLRRLQYGLTTASVGQLETALNRSDLTGTVLHTQCSEMIPFPDAQHDTAYSGEGHSGPCQTNSSDTCQVPRASIRWKAKARILPNDAEAVIGPKGQVERLWDGLPDDAEDEDTVYEGERTELPHSDAAAWWGSLEHSKGLRLTRDYPAFMSTAQQTERGGDGTYALSTGGDGYLLGIARPELRGRITTRAGGEGVNGEARVPVVFSVEVK